jgi:hypothetical protein
LTCLSCFFIVISTLYAFSKGYLYCWNQFIWYKASKHKKLLEACQLLVIRSWEGYTLGRWAVEQALPEPKGLLHIITQDREHNIHVVSGKGTGQDKRKIIDDC